MIIRNNYMIEDAMRRQRICSLRWPTTFAQTIIDLRRIPSKRLHDFKDLEIQRKMEVLINSNTYVSKGKGLNWYFKQYVVSTSPPKTKYNAHQCIK